MQSNAPAIQSLKKLFMNKHGEVVLWQRPNLILVVAAAASILKYVLPFGNPAYIAELVSFGGFFTWAWQELTQGVSLFRKFLGVAILLVLIISRIS